MPRGWGGIDAQDRGQEHIQDQESAALLEQARLSVPSSPGEALSLAQRAHRSAVVGGDERTAAVALHTVGWAQIHLCVYEDALATFEQALLRFARLEDHDGRLLALIGIGEVYHRVGQFDLSLEYFEQVLSDAAERGFATHKTAALYRIGEVCESMRRKDDALEFYLRSREVAAAEDDPDMLTTLDIAIGDVYRKMHRVEAARFHLGQALEAAEQRSADIARAECLTSLGRLHQDLAEYEDAEKCHRESIELCDRCGNRFGLIEAEHHLGWLLQQTGRPDEALDHYLRAIDVGESIEAGAHAHRSYLRASEVHEKRGDVRQALDFYRRGVELRANLSNESLQRRLRGLIFNFEYDRSQDDRLQHDIEYYRSRAGELRRKTEALAEANRRLTVIGRIGRDIASALDLGKLMFAVHNAIDSLLSADSLGLGVYDESAHSVEYKFFIEAGRPLKPFTVDMDSSRSLGVWCIRKRREVVIGDIAVEYERYLIERPDHVGDQHKSMIFVPLVVEDRAIGLLTVQSRKRHAYGQSDIETLRVLSSYIAVALEKSLILERLIKLNNELIAEKAELERANEIIRHMANHDNLTGLPNRRLLYDVMGQHVPLARRQGHSFVVLYIDLDEFKPVNDRFGHGVGDMVLRTIAARLGAVVRSSDVVARIGGDEFVLVMRDVKDLASASATIDKVIGALEEPITLDEGSIVVGSSAGASVFPDDGETLDELLQRADEAMYRVKQENGTRSWAFYGE